jgi:hypothetical protein
VVPFRRTHRRYLLLLTDTVQEAVVVVPVEETETETETTDRNRETTATATHTQEVHHQAVFLKGTLLI